MKRQPEKQTRTLFSQAAKRIIHSHPVDAPVSLEHLRSAITHDQAKKEKAPQPQRPLKLWEIASSYHCSIIGTCLTLGELRTLVKKAGITIDKNTFDYEIHGVGVHHAGKKGLLSKRIEQKLRQKYRTTEKRYAIGNSERELMALWDEDLKSGNVAGAYWALLRNPHLSDKSRQHAFGEVHMLSHLVGSSQRVDMARLRVLEERCQQQEQLAEKNCEWMKESEQTRCRLKRNLEEKEKTVRLLEGRLGQAMRFIDQLESRSEIGKLNERLAELKQKYDDRATMLDRIAHQLDESQKDVRSLQLENAQLQTLVEKRECELRERTEECIGAEELLIAELSKHMSSDCDDCLTSRCPGPELCGKRILYVGGQTNLIRHYKALIELYGGEFIHHDGGMEDARKRLASLMAQADVLFCPVDCISHDACLRVKRTCKQMGKRFVPLRSSGVSSLARGLTAIQD